MNFVSLGWWIRSRSKQKIGAVKLISVESIVDLFGDGKGGRGGVPEG